MDRCFVYIQLPQSLETVTCGRYSQERTSGGDVVGRFVYGRRYRTRPDAVPIDPLHLPIADITFETYKLGGIFGALRDASPDAWGRRVIERALGRTDVGEIDYLLNSPEDRAGALSFGLGEAPPPPVRDFNRTLDLAELLSAARELETLSPGEAPSASLLRLQQLVETGTSMGGARPKNVVEDESGLWLAKFPSRTDKWNNAAVEAAMLSLARQCNIRTPHFRVETVAGAPVLLVQRFDRQRGADGYLRSRMVSALTVLDADESGDRSRWSYLALGDELQRWSSKPANDRQELFRRMAFNALITNNDDHLRNHALVAVNQEWRLSPAFDLTPCPTHAHERDLAMTCGLAAGRRATKVNLLSVASRFGFKIQEASALIDEMRALIGNQWEQEIKKFGGTESDCNTVRPAFGNPGFDAPE